MSLQQQLATELARRAGLLTEEIAVWRAATDANTDGMGIHQSQIRAVTAMLEAFAGEQERLLGELTDEREPAAFAERRQALEAELTAAHGVMAIFRLILAQREDPTHYRRPLDAADLIAAYGYKPAIERVVGWGVLTEDQLRAPPLTYLNSLYSPAAFTRRHGFGAFKMPLDGYYDLKLPISVISLPFHHTETVWTFGTLYHEVGHVLDQDLGLLHALRPAVERELPNPDRGPLWSLWVREMIADTFGVLLGGRGFALTLLKLLYLPRDQVTRLDAADVHPTPYLRVFLLAALLRELAVPALETTADELLEEWKALYEEPPELTPFLAECPTAAQVLLDQPLDALAGHRLRDFATPTELSAAQQQVEVLAKYLRSGFLRPNPKTYPVRLVAAAAQLAAHAVTDRHAETYAGIQERAFAFIEAVREGLPTFLAAEADAFDTFSGAREAYLRQLVRNADFSRLADTGW